MRSIEREIRWRGIDDDRSVNREKSMMIESFDGEANIIRTKSTNVVAKKGQRFENWIGSE